MTSSFARRRRREDPSSSVVPRGRRGRREMRHSRIRHERGNPRQTSKLVKAFSSKLAGLSVLAAPSYVQLAIRETEELSQFRDGTSDEFAMPRLAFRETRSGHASVVQISLEQRLDVSGSLDSRNLWRFFGCLVADDLKSETRRFITAT